MVKWFLPILLILSVSSSLAQVSNPALANAVKKEESLDVLICPEVGKKFISTSETTFRSMQDLLDVLVEQRKQSTDFFLTLIQLNKTNPEHEEAASKIVDIKKGLDQKLTRAKSNYNSEIKMLATSLPKAKRCWSYHTTEHKPLVGRLMEIFQKEPIFKEYKNCIGLIESNNKLYMKKFNLSVNFYNKIKSQGTTIMEAKSIDKEIEKTKIGESKACSPFFKGGTEKFLDYFEGRYDHKTGGELSRPVKKTEPSTATPEKIIRPLNSKSFGPQLGL